MLTYSLSVSFKMDNMVSIGQQLFIIIRRQRRNFPDSSYFDSINLFSHLMRYDEMFNEFNLIMKLGESARILSIY